MNKAIITADALNSLSRIFVSCKPIMSDILKENQIYLIKHAKEGRDVNFNEFVSGLPSPDPTYKQILDYSKRAGLNTITETAVQLFFGSEPHFEKIISQLTDPKLKLPLDFAQKILFAHILIPVTISQITPNIKATYLNSAIRINISNLVSLERDNLVVGKIVLAHYASIISDQPKQSIVDILLEEQAKRPEFISASMYVQELKGIDYDDFWDLSRYTKKTIAERSL